jgi:predicted ribosome quality control (RQC) complex YloA/Tae2 family protein
VKKNNKRIYQIETDLLQLYTYSLSQTVSNLILSVPETKKITVTEIHFE